MLIDETINIIVKEILGEKIYRNLIEECAHDCEEFRESTIDKDLHDISPMLDSCCVAILMLGFSNKKFFLEKYKIMFDKKRIVEIQSRDFCIKFKEYIDKIEGFKIELLQQIT